MFNRFVSALLPIVVENTKKPGLGIPRQARQGGLEASPSVREKALERENRELKEKLAELYLENTQLKKLGDWLRQRKSATTSVITAQNLARSPKDSKS
jgi:hypothetical protein